MAVSAFTGARALTALLLLGALALAPRPAAATKLMRWVDEKGQVHYGDKIPPQYAKQGREELDKRGLVTKTVPRELDAAGRERLREQQAEVERVARRADYDRYLMKAFGSVADLQASREDRLAALDSRIALARKAAAENEQTLDELRGRAASQPANQDIAKQIESFEASLVDNLQLTQRLQAERTATEERYAEDIERFKLLRSGKIKPGA